MKMRNLATGELDSRRLERVAHALSHVRQRDHRCRDIFPVLHRIARLEVPDDSSTRARRNHIRRRGGVLC